jgi:hypothetical protein
MGEQKTMKKPHGKASNRYLFIRERLPAERGCGKPVS